MCSAPALPEASQLMITHHYYYLVVGVTHSLLPPDIYSVHPKISSAPKNHPSQLRMTYQAHLDNPSIFYRIVAEGKPIELLSGDLDVKANY